MVTQCSHRTVTVAALAVAALMGGASVAAAQGDPCGLLSLDRPEDHPGETAVFTGIDHADRAFTLTQNQETGTWALWAITEFSQEAGGLEVGRPCVVISGSESKLMIGAVEEEAVAAVEPQPAPQPASEEETFRVARVAGSSVLDLRTGPGTDYESIAEMPPGTAGIHVGSCKDVSGYQYPWCEATWQDTQGWASACCLEGEQTGRRLD